jgi:D-sedoheptulose 7-phosphate isomerase
VNVQTRRAPRGAGSQSRSDLDFVAARIERRIDAGARFFDANAEMIAACAAAMAERFYAGATLLVFGSGPHATDAQHNSVEFVHPVLPGCRALPAIALSNDVATVTGTLEGTSPESVYALQLRLLGRPEDIALAFAHAPQPRSVSDGLRTAESMGMLTVAITSGADRRGGSIAAHHLHCDDGDLLTAHELHLATYHMLWELVHIVLNHRGIRDST